MIDRGKTIEGLEYLITAYAFHGEDEKCLGDAVELLKEQEPVSPDYEPTTLSWSCGNCGQSFDRCKYKYCPICGRKVEW